ncbi:uncharacterized protein perm1b [Eucyclogobius newberryi]|uniref:uncharacterized protein perm1b n=1 Tax=Eucyclogobius newberryi TaxID=166745 RepID=UPI003B593A53
MDDLDHSMNISDHDWLSFLEESEECCLIQASLAHPDSSCLSDADEPDFTTQTYAPKKVHKAVEDPKEPGVAGEDGSIFQSSSAVCGKGRNDPQSESKPVMKDALEGDCVTGVNDKPPQQTMPVDKKKEKKIQISKVDCTHNGEANIDILKPGKLPEQIFSNTNAGSLETDIITKYVESSCKGDSLDRLDKENTSESIKIKSESAQIQLNTDLKCIGVSCKKSMFSLKHTSEPKDIKFDTCNETSKHSKTLDSMFIQEKDRNVSSDSSHTKLTMALTCLQDSSIDDLDNSNSTKVKNSTCVEKGFQIEVNIERTCLKDCSNEEEFQNMAIENSKTDTSNNLDTINQTRNSSSWTIQEDHSKMNSLTCFGASCKDLTLENAVVDFGKPTVCPITYHTNSIESDEFADYETFSNSSYDSETYHSAAESMEDPRHLSMHNSTSNPSITINDESLIDRGILFTKRCFKRDDSLSLIESSQIVPSAQASADNTPNDNSTCSSGTDSTALCMSVDTTTFADNSDSLGERPESLPQLDVSMESPEAYANATGNSQPVFAISAFWDEMEKLTINDILQIRMGRCMLPIEEAIITDDVEPTCKDNASAETIDLINLPESAVLDTLDTADSDYCTNLDESKLDSSSWDFSTSDCEEEYWQFINLSRNTSPDQDDKGYPSESTDYISTGDKSDDMGTPVPSEGCSGQNLCDSTVSTYTLAVPQQIRKNKSMYDIHAPKSTGDLSSRAFWDRSSCMSLEEPLRMNDGFEVEVVTPIPRVFEYLFHDNEAKCEAMSLSVYGLQGNYASPMTDYTFCTATNDLPPMPYSEGPIPIFSCSRPTVRERTFPKPGCIFLGTNYTTIKDVSPIKIVSESILRGMDCTHADRSYSFSQDLTSLYSVEKICFLDKRSDVWTDQAEDEEKPVDATDSNVRVFSVTPKMFKDAALWKNSMEKNQMPSNYQSIFSTIKQSDMCLVCIAFASWVLKSSDPEAADAWKAALLANVSALSAIQYLRHYMKKKTSLQDEG